MLLAVFDVLDDLFTRPDYRGCLFLTATTEFPSRKHPVHKAAAAHYEESEAQLRGIAEAARAPNPAALARTWVILLQGAIMTRGTTGDDSAARVARQAAEQLLATALPPA